MTPSGASIRLLTLNPKKFLISRAYIKKVHYLSSIENVDDDREMGIGENHFEFVSGSDTVNHVSNSASNCAKSGISLLLLKPHSEFDSFLSGFFKLIFSDFEGAMPERFSDLSERS